MGAVKKAVLFMGCVGAVAAAGYFILPARHAPLSFIAPYLQSNFLLWSWANFDGEHYLSIAKYGYQIRGGFTQYAFFPLYPLLIKLVAFIVRDYLIAGILITFASLTIIIRVLPLWLREIRAKGADTVMISLLLAPGAVYLAAVYTEPLFLAIACTVFYLAERKKWGAAIVLAALGTATRVNGLFLAGFLVGKILLDRNSGKKYRLLSLFSFSGIAGYMTYLDLRTGDPLAWFHTQDEWGKGTATSPIVTAGNYLRAVTVDFSPDLIHFVVVIEVLVTVWALYLAWTAVRRKLLGYPYLFYSIGNLAMPIATGSLGSMPRFILTLFPLFIVYPHLAPRTRFIALLISSILAGIGTVLFTRGYWYG